MRPLMVQDQIIKDCTGWDFKMWLLAVLMGWVYNGVSL